jgi:hypothetical protein
VNSPERWLEIARADARARGRDDAVPVLEAFARAMQVLRSADWNESPETVGRPAETREQA